MSTQVKKTRKYCIVPLCTNNSNKTPEKIFIRLPGEQKRRSLWLSAIHRHPADFSTKTCAFICEDHFNLEHDMLNYEEYKSGIGKVRMRSDVMPHIFSEEWRQQSLLEPIESSMPKRRASKSYNKNRYAQQIDYNFPFLQYENEMDIAALGGDFDDIDSLTSYNEVEYVYVKPDSTEDFCDNMDPIDSTQENTTVSDVTENDSRTDKEASNSTVVTPNLTELDEKVRNIIEQQKEQIEQEKLQSKESPKSDIAEKEQPKQSIEMSEQSEQKQDVVEDVKANERNDNDEKKKDEQYLNYTPSTQCQSDIDVQYQYQNSLLTDNPIEDYIRNEFGDSFLGPEVANQLNQIPELPEVSQALPDLLELSQLTDLNQIADGTTHLGDITQQLPDIPQMPKQIPEMTQHLPNLQNYFQTQTNQPNIYPNGYANGTFQNVPQYPSALDFVPPNKQYNFPNDPYQNRYYNGYRGPHVNSERLSQFPYPANFTNYLQNQMMPRYNNNNNYYPLQQQQQHHQNVPNSFYPAMTLEKPQQYWPGQPYQNFPDPYVNPNLVPRSPDVVGLPPPPPYVDDVNRSNQWFKCDMCNQSFMGKYALYRHYKSHTGGGPHHEANPYRCNICTRTFLYSSNLQYHLLTHTNY